MTDTELAANAAAALEALRENESDINREIDILQARLEVTRETIALLAGSSRRGRPKGSGRKASVPVEPVDATTELETADAGAARSPALE